MGRLKTGSKIGARTLKDSIQISWSNSIFCRTSRAATRRKKATLTKKRNNTLIFWSASLAKKSSRLLISRNWSSISRRNSKEKTSQNDIVSLYFIKNRAGLERDSWLAAQRNDHDPRVSLEERYGPVLVRFRSPYASCKIIQSERKRTGTGDQRPTL